MNRPLFARSTRWIASLVVLGLAAGCADDVEPPFEPEGTGAVEGLLFYDENRDGVFDPSAGDIALSGANLIVRERGTDAAFSGAADVSDEDGRFLIEGLPAGTHDLFVDPASLPESIDLTLCQNPVPVTVYLGETQFEAVGGQPSCLITIEEAEALPFGEFVTVQGLVTSFPGQIANNSTYIQDETGAIQIYSGSLEGQGIEIGDRIQVSGTLSEYNDQLQIQDATLDEMTEDVAEPVIEEITTAEVAAAGAPPSHPLQGVLVGVSGAELTQGFGEGGLNYRNALIDDGSGPVQIRLDSGVASDEEIAALMEMGVCYDVVGVIGNFRGTAQLFPRSLEDIVEVACE